MLEIVLFTTSGCHLCEQAEKILRATVQPEHLKLEYQDVSESDALIEQYGTRIPVLQIKGMSGELSWPFDQEQLIEFITRDDPR